jgi:FkbM family methyltransferase
VIETIHWHTLHPRYLGPDSTILDLGANRGFFCEAIVKRFGCTCVAVEPAPFLYDIIPQSNHISKIQAAIAGRSGEMLLSVNNENLLASRLTDVETENSVTVNVLTLPELFNRLAWSRIDLLKVDIEGAEIEMLASCSDDFLSRCIAQISIEFHDFCGITSPQVVKATLDRLHLLGFYSVRMSRVGHQDTWLINQKLLDISSLELFFIKYIARNVFGIKRVCRRYARRFLTE